MIDEHGMGGPRVHTAHYASGRHNWPTAARRGAGPRAKPNSGSDASGWSRRAVADDGRAKVPAEVRSILSGLVVVASLSNMLPASSGNRGATRGSALDS